MGNETTLDTAQLLDKIRALGLVTVQTMEQQGDETASVAFVPDGQRVQNLTEITDTIRPRPRRRTGTAIVADVDSFIAHVNRFKDGHSALFGHLDIEAKPPIATLTSVLDYHEEGASEAALPRWGQHRTYLEMALHKDLRAWLKVDGERMNQRDFAEFMEDRIVDVILPPPQLLTKGDGEPKDQADGGDFGEKTQDERLAAMASLLGGSFATPSRLSQLSKGLKLTETAKVGSAVNLSSGEAQLVYETEHTDRAGEKLKVPNLFLIAVPVFVGGPRYRIAVRLRYRVFNGSVSWSTLLVQPEVSIEDAFKGACTRAKDETALPLIMGQPE
ncbi:MAG: DUF2303 family protein [Pseudomonadota bacterium]